METVYKCEYCNETFNSPEECERHEQRHDTDADNYIVHKVSAGSNNFGFPFFIIIKNKTTGDCAAYNYPTLTNVK